MRFILVGLFDLVHENFTMLDRACFWISLLFSQGILDQSAVWVDEINYYDMRTDRNKGMPPLSLRPANPLGIEIDK